MENTVLITGASRGIGKETALLLASQGYNVAVGYNKNKQKAEEVVAQILSSGYSAQAFHIDVAADESVLNCINQVNQAYGKITAVVNNAGIAQQKLFCDITSEEWFNMININLSGVYRVCKAVLAQMITQKSGAIVNVSSMWGQIGASCEVHYSAAKGGVIALTKALAKEVAPCNIRVNCVAPGAVETDMLSEFSAQDKQEIAQDTPMGRLGTPADIANSIAFLLSGNAGFITGQVLGVNGGMVI